MATSTVARVAIMASLLLGLASVASAQVAHTSTMHDLPDYLDNSAMALSISPSIPGTVVLEYKVAPLTRDAGLNQTNENSLRVFNVRASMVIADQQNYSELDVRNNIVYMTCDSATNSSYITPDDVLNAIMAKGPKAILLFSTAGTCCSLEGPNLPFTSVWTMTDPQEAWMTNNLISDPTEITIATISGNYSAADRGNDQPQGNNSAVAMSILYSITGLITLLFLIIIATGAIRAHRHPERYGPRASYGGRPRQSRAKGLARAVLETLPIVKFGDPHPAKPDLENELDSISGDRPQQQPTATTRSGEPNGATEAGASPEAAAAAATSKIGSGAASETSVVSDKNKTDSARAEDDHLGCSICTEDFTVGEDVRVLPCGHKFHPQCIDPWLVNVSGTCPLCRLDLRPQEDSEDDHTAGHLDIHNDHVDSLPIPPSEDDADGVQRRRISRLLDWNRLRHATVDERIQALRQYRQSQQGAGAGAGSGSAEDQSRHAKLSDRLREKFHIRTRVHPPADSPSTGR
ncbi:hypothetical protein GGS23DRAFT_93787 [Durotheca rogersii]|uniref:uncharacterized protein n=1 Tax=Durotheca rogersii TaxID=419775 RepID=UPI002220F1FA|nr:uncharacterized protein GGS23DRAFT_93787 [Durotheca rogersii]KAI5862335.1 hypothetical protein GGS23DRAFT_93787 [Durotheca rogersii]